MLDNLPVVRGKVQDHTTFHDVKLENSYDRLSLSVFNKSLIFDWPLPPYLDIMEGEIESPKNISGSR